ncbi:OmpH family outer membrane protein [Olivibacter sp. SDN3]|uniref:OmpH family outer membrane protein n=1 Tax=Olivibacter sp. SDN3 TaxID=2764720 RepID=UPI001651B057|nr:OmpH family outer membrane protein [Olivibacter sp. SDN3]QNL49999.1 OmpH family outer membrane protein [Olivibacter sp. SDN3]
MNTKKILFTFAFLLITGTYAFAQRLAYVDSEYILKHIPEYVSAQKQLEDMSEKWQKEVDGRYSEIEKMYKAYQQDQVMLSDDMRKKREDEIVQKERETKDFQRKIFGFEGDLYQERLKLIKPIQERVSKAIQAVAESQNLEMVLDKGSEVTFLYSNPKLDRSDDVITRLGYKPEGLAK